MTLTHNRYVVPTKSMTGCCKRKIGFLTFDDAFAHALFMATKRTIPRKKMWVYVCKARTGRFHIGNRWLEVPIEVYKLMKHIAKLEHSLGYYRKLAMTSEAKSANQDQEKTT